MAGTVTALSVLVVVWQVKVNFDRSRRERALDVLNRWDNYVDENTWRFSKLMSELPSVDVEKIYKGHPILISKELADEFYPERQRNEDSSLHLPADQTRKIRLCMVHLLNGIEDIALAYKHGVADKEILHDAYYNFLIEKEFLKDCRKFMKHFGDGAWPVLNELDALMAPTASNRKSPA